MGSLYVIHATGTTHYKIGITDRDIKNRLANLQTGNHCKLALVRIYPDVGTPEIEARVHAFLASHRSNGEWFDLDSPFMVDVALARLGLKNENALKGKFITQKGLKSTSDRFDFALQVASNPGLGWLLRVVFFVWALFVPIRPIMGWIEPSDYGLIDASEIDIFFQANPYVVDLGSIQHQNADEL